MLAATIPAIVHHEILDDLLGAYLPIVSTQQFLENEVILPKTSDSSFWLNSFRLPRFNFENADSFVERLFRHELLVIDPVVTAVLTDHVPELAPRTVRHRFVQTIGLPPSTVRQIERAREALSLLQNGISILDVVYHTGYADQSHLTRSLKYFMGYTPAKVPEYTYPE